MPVHLRLFYYKKLAKLLEDREKKIKDNNKPKSKVKIKK